MDHFLRWAGTDHMEGTTGNWARVRKGVRKYFCSNRVMGEWKKVLRQSGVNLTACKVLWITLSEAWLLILNMCICNARKFPCGNESLSPSYIQRYVYPFLPTYSLEGILCKTFFTLHSAMLASLSHTHCFVLPLIWYKISTISFRRVHNSTKSSWVQA